MVQLVGRDAELRLLEDLVRRVEGGSPQFVTFEGPPGIGKTALVNRLLERIGDWRHLVVDLDPADAEQQGSTVARLVEQLRRSADPPLAVGPLPESVPELVQIVLDATDAVDGLTCLVFEDAQWIDEFSAEVLWRCARELRGGRSLIVFTQRPNDSAFSSRIDRFLSSGRKGAHVMLEPLDGRQVQQLLAGRLRAPVSEEAARIVLDATNGVPLLVATIAQHLVAAPVGQRRLPRALRALAREADGRHRLFEHALLDTLHELPHGERAAVSLLALSRRPLHPSDLTRLLADAGESPVDEAGLLRSGLVAARGDGELSISHEYLATRIAGQLPAADRAALHRALASLPDPAESLRHRALAHRYGDPADSRAELLAELVEQATTALRGGQTRTAFTRCRWALWFTDDPAVLALALRCAAMAAVPSERLAEIGEEIERARPGRLRSAGRAMLLLDAGRLDDAAGELRAGLGFPEDSPDAAGTLLIGSVLSMAGRLAFATGRFGAVASLLDAGRDEIAALRGGWERAAKEVAAEPEATRARLAAAIVEAHSLEALLTLWSSLRHGDPRRLGEFLAEMKTLLTRLDGIGGTERVRDVIGTITGGSQRQLGHPVEAYALLTAAIERRQLAREQEVYARTHLGFIAFQAGLWDEAQALFTAAVEACLMLPEDSGTLLSSVGAALVPLARGEREAGDALLARAAALQGGAGPVVAAGIAHARGVEAMFRDDHAAAVAHFAEVDETGIGWAYIGLPWIVSFARATALRGEHAGAPQTIEGFDPGSYPGLGPREAVEAALIAYRALARGEPETAVRGLLAALAHWDREPSVHPASAPRKGGGFALQRAFAALDLAELVRSTPVTTEALPGVLREAAVAAGEASEFFLRCGAFTQQRRAAEAEHALRALAESGRADDRSSATDEASLRSLSALTSRERQVALEVARGKSNREIATELYLSVRTVEYHVSNCLAKLGLANRFELRRALRSTAEPPALAG